MKDNNERPLPSDVPTEQTLTISDFLRSVGHPQADMIRATLRFGQFAFNKYRKQFGHAPYTRRINGNGPTKVYTAADLPLLERAYIQWKYNQSGKEPVQ